MSIQNLNRLTIAGLTSDKHAVLNALQDLGCLHLIPLRPAPREPEKEPTGHAVETVQALRYLQDVRDKRRQVRDPEGFDLETVVRAVLENQQRRREVSDRRDALAERAAELEPWGDFELPPEADLAGRKLWFYILPQRQLRQLETLELPWQVVHRDNRQAWVVVIHPDEPPRDALPVPRTLTGALSLTEVKRRLEAAEVELEAVQAEHQALTRWIYLISSHLAEAEDQAQLRLAHAQTHDEDSLFLVQGWAPDAALEAVQALTDRRGLALLAEPPAPGDAPPTLLENPPAIAAGQDLVAFYQMPAYDAWDPSRVLFFSFAAFFAMILSDAGYALLLGLLLVLYWGRLGRTEVGQRMRLLAATLVGTSVVWGMLVGSYFGFAPSPETLLGQLHLLDINDFEIMMRISVAIGVAHLVMANLEMAVAARGRAAGRVALGWIAAMLGGFALWILHGAGAPEWLSMTAQGLLILGLAVVLLLGSDRRIDGLKALALRAFDGLSALVRVTQAFGDVLSYLRLFALGLASASMAMTFNGLARDTAAGLPGIGLLLAILILLAGHTLNLLLALMSGVVHGLRLNFIEFYNWALAGEGYPFKPFKRTELRE
ncbi:V-type ATP synthase subunit I [Halochromatium glycolicum]|jgi:V/A-type H+-transporting ATPase subunit I|uniref:V-type ATP synthase subunit I n=1 Tax=Halochromatium glycolicum TaxID=85075 RepID=A0AAJ0U2Y4_9GAMM|nr:V-type ATPase 116kDa subunit family protein [Halochromatium glycolicum]MBK1704325.1 V-type ATP synthase subunit I [Halochromatium glycolicum]